MLATSSRICVVLALAALASSASASPGVDPPAPVLPPIFVAPFQESMDYYIHTFHTKGVLYFDATSSSERVDREDGVADRYCGTARPFAGTFCSHLIVDSKRYLLFPQKDHGLGADSGYDCCFCCSAEDGCGVLRRDFLSNATFVGYETLNGTRAQHWREEGLQENDYWQTDDGQQRPLRLLQKPNDDMVFLGFSDAPIDPSVFELPKSCAEGRKCGGTCALVRRG